MVNARFPPASAPSELRRRSIVKFLNEELATTLMSVLRARRHHFLCAYLGGDRGLAASDELLRHAQKEMVHADLVVARIIQLQGAPTSAWAVSQNAGTSTVRSVARSRAC